MQEPAVSGLGFGVQFRAENFQYSNYSCIARHSVFFLCRAPSIPEPYSTYSSCCARSQETLSQRVQVPNNCVLGFGVIVIRVQVLSKYMIVGYLDPQGENIAMPPDDHYFFAVFVL